jgi:hypothetical protein
MEKYATLKNEPSLNRYKGSIKFDYGDKVVTINVNKFAGGNSQSSAGIGTRTRY